MPRTPRPSTRRSSRCAPRRRAQRPHRPARRRGLRRLVRLRRALPHSHRRASCRRRPQVHPLPQYGDVRADTSGAPHRAQPSHRRDGRHHRARQRRARLHVATPQHLRPARRDARLNGYSTAQFGKCHEVPVWETSPMGPFGQWPTGSGFEHFYGFIGAETNQYYPGLVDGTRHVEPDRTPEEGYHLSEDLTDRAIDWVRQQKALMPDKPFFVYFAPGATHAPHHVPKEWSEKYRGRFDQGWDACARRRFARQKELGVVPPDAELTRRPAEIPAWDEMPEAMQAGAGTADGGLRRLPRAHRPPRRAAHRRPGGPRGPRRHARLLHHRRQRRQRRGRPRGHPQRVRDPQRDLPGDRGAHDARVRARAPRRLRYPRRLQPVRGGLGPRDGHAVSVDQAGRLALGRHAQRDDRALARRHPGQGRGAPPVPPRDRRGADRAGGGRPATSRSWSTASSRSPTRA